MWIKYFADGSTIREPASWSRTKLDGIISVELMYKGTAVRLTGATEYWQSDDFVSMRSNPMPKLIKRRIEKKLDSGQWEIAEIDNLGQLSQYVSPGKI